MPKRKKKENSAPKKLKVNCVMCPRCEDVIYSRARHDYHACRCGDTVIDGGFDYIKIGGVGAQPKILTCTINATKSNLAHDYMYGTNKYGIIGVEGW